MTITHDTLPEYPRLTPDEKDAIRAEILASCELIADCWVYRGSLNEKGYGIKRIGKRIHSVSRYMLAYTTRESLNCRWDACHDPKKCAYRSCCNPAHLFWASRAQNCHQREEAEQKERAIFSWWETHSTAPGIDRCIASLNRGKVERKKQGATDFDHQIAAPQSLSPFVLRDTKAGLHGGIATTIAVTT